MSKNLNKSEQLRKEIEYYIINNYGKSLGDTSFRANIIYKFFYCMNGYLKTGRNDFKIQIDLDRDKLLGKGLSYTKFILDVLDLPKSEINKIDDSFDGMLNLYYTKSINQKLIKSIDEIRNKNYKKPNIIKRLVKKIF